jgi:predicted Zn-dependent peptidase
MEYQSYQLHNGIRIIHKQVPNLVAHCGIIINAGSRDEEPKEHGLAHFIEHVIFKGTQKRKAHHILTRLEDVGGEINAYTTKEETCVYTSFMHKDYGRALELLTDIVFHSVFPDKELEREKEIIYDEINSYKDSPSELIFDDFDEVVFKDNPMGRNILGTKRVVKSFSRKHIDRFIQKNYKTDQIVIASVGNVRFNRLLKLVNRYFSDIPANTGKHARQPFEHYVPEHIEMKKRTYQAHCIMGNVAYSYKHDNRLGMHLLNNLLGGPGLSSRLNMTLREKNGYSYNTESNYTTYTDTGTFAVYFGTDKHNLEKSMQLVLKEFAKLRDKKLGTAQLAKAKRQLIGQIAISSENYENHMLSIGKGFLIYDRVDSFHETIKKIEHISADHLLEISNEVLNESKMSYLIYN